MKQIVDFPALLQMLGQRDQQLRDSHSPAGKLDDRDHFNIWTNASLDKMRFNAEHPLYVRDRIQFFNANHISRLQEVGKAQTAELEESLRKRSIMAFGLNPDFLHNLDDPEWGYLKATIEALDPQGRLKVEITPKQS